jgi:hypothetical protein
MIVAQHEVLGRIFKSDTSRTGRSMAHADHSIAMPLRTMKKIDRLRDGGRVFSRFPALRTGLLSQCPSGTGRVFAPFPALRTGLLQCPSGTAYKYTCPTAYKLHVSHRPILQHAGLRQPCFKPRPGTQVRGYSLSEQPSSRTPEVLAISLHGHLIPAVTTFNISESSPGTVVRFPIADYPKSEPVDRIRQFCRRSEGPLGRPRV